jgi:hypothetical protein
MTNGMYPEATGGGLKSRYIDGVLYFYNAAGAEVYHIDPANKTVTIPSGATLELASGATASIIDGALAAADMSLTTGSILLGVAGKAAALDVKTDTGILIGNGTTAAVKTLSGDVSMSNAGAVTIAAGAVEPAMLSAGAGVAAIVTAGLGGSASYAKTADGLQTALVALNAAKARGAIAIAVVDETFNDNGGTQPAFLVGETDDTDAAFAAATFTNAVAGTVFVKGFQNTANKAIVVNATKAVTTGLGGISVTVLALPNS